MRPRTRLAKCAHSSCVCASAMALLERLMSADARCVCAQDLVLALLQWICAEQDQKVTAVVPIAVIRVQHTQTLTHTHAHREDERGSTGRPFRLSASRYAFLSACCASTSLTACAACRSWTG